MVPSSNVQRRTPWSACYITGTLLSTRASRYALSSSTSLRPLITSTTTFSYPSWLRWVCLTSLIVRWICAYLRHRRRRVNIGDILSDWLQLAAGMPQWSYLGPLTFVILIDSLRPGSLTHKFVDDTTMTEKLNKSLVSMQSFVDELTTGS